MNSKNLTKWRVFFFFFGDFPLSFNTGRGYMERVLKWSQTLPAASGWRKRPHQPWRRTGRRYQSPASEPQDLLLRRSANTQRAQQRAFLQYCRYACTFTAGWIEVAQTYVLFIVVHQNVHKSSTVIYTKVLFFRWQRAYESIWAVQTLLSYWPKQGPEFETTRS